MSIKSIKVKQIVLTASIISSLLTFNAPNAKSAFFSETVGKKLPADKYLRCPRSLNDPIIAKCFDKKTNVMCYRFTHPASSKATKLSCVRL